MQDILKTILIALVLAVLPMPGVVSAQSLSELEEQLKDLQDKYQELLDKADDTTKDRSNRATVRSTNTNVYSTIDFECTDIDRNLSFGMVDYSDNEPIKTLQLFLKASGDYTYPRATGFFGNETMRAVTRFQTRAGVLPAGGYGVAEATTRDRIKEISCADDANDVPSISPNIIPSGRIGQYYTGELVTSNTSGLTSLVLVEGTLPAGLSFVANLNGHATISGTPRRAGVNTFTVWAISAEGGLAKRTYQFIINDRDGALFGP
ncbi:MAG: peptidoglycan-binding protein [Patescibacteria group bacterium]